MNTSLNFENNLPVQLYLADLTSNQKLNEDLILKKLFLFKRI